MTKIFEIYATDLTTEAQKELCRILKIQDLSDANYDVFPITSIEFDTEDEEDTDELL